jgi:hypothetical protein
MCILHEYARDARQRLKRGALEVSPVTPCIPTPEHLRSANLAEGCFVPARHTDLQLASCSMHIFALSKESGS